MTKATVASVCALYGSPSSSTYLRPSARDTAVDRRPPRGWRCCGVGRGRGREGTAALCAWARGEGRGEKGGERGGGRGGPLGRKPVRREEDVGGGRVVELVALVRDEPRERRDVALPVVPGGDDHVLELSELLVGVEYALEQAEARAGGGDRELRVQRQHHQPLDPVRLDRLQRVLRVRRPVPHGHVRASAHPPRGEGLLDGLALRDRRRQLRRAAADRRVPLPAARARAPNAR